MKPPPTKIPVAFCSFCHKTFKPTRRWQLYCSNKCRQARHTEDFAASLVRDEARRLELEAQVESMEKTILDLQDQLKKALC